MLPRSQHLTASLSCRVCGDCVSGFARGWRAYRADQERQRNIIVLCAECAERELGEDSPKAT